MLMNADIKTLAGSEKIILPLTVQKRKNSVVNINRFHCSTPSELNLDITVRILIFKSR